MSPDRQQFLTDDQVRAAIPMPDAIEAVRKAFHDLRGGGFDAPPRQVLHDGSVLVMTAYHRASRSAIVKTLTYNVERAPVLNGSVSWHELDRPDTFSADAQVITTLRTGAIAGLATDLLAAPDAGDLALIGAGAQAYHQVLAVHTVRPLRSLSIVDLDRAKAEQLAARLGPELAGAEIRLVPGVREAVGDADVVSCATTSKKPLFDATWLRPSVHVNAIGAFRPDMHELPQELLAESAVVVDDLDACLEESGEIIDAVAHGTLARGAISELAAILGSPPERQGRTVFKTVGIPAQDWAIGAALAARFLPSPEPRSEKRDQERKAA